MRALQQLLAMAAAGGVQGLAEVCERLPQPSDAAVEDAALPSPEGGLGAAGWRVFLCPVWLGCHLGASLLAAQRHCIWSSLASVSPLPFPAWPCTRRAPPPAGLSAAQRSVAARLPLLHELFACLIKPSCAKELEPMCSCLGLVAGVLPPEFAGAGMGGGGGRAGGRAACPAAPG